MAVQEEISEFIRERTLVEIVRERKDERLYEPKSPFSRMGINEEGAIWIAGEIENQFGVNLMPLLRKNLRGKDNYRLLKPEDIIKYIVRRVN